VQTVAFASSFLERADYDGAARTLTVHFDDGSIYRYSDVPPEVFAGFGRAKAGPGILFNNTIRGQFRFVRLTPFKARRNARPAEPAASPTPATPPVAIACQTPEQMDKRKRKLVSVALEAVSYDAEKKCLVLYFDSKHVYLYGNVPLQVYQRLLAPGPDPGSYFNAAVRNNHNYPAQRLH
jgi:hypothetical protein